MSRGRNSSKRFAASLAGRKVMVKIVPTVDRVCRPSGISFDYIEINGTGIFRKRK